jgi:hypothetical protein
MVEKFEWVEKARISGSGPFPRIAFSRPSSVWLINARQRRLGRGAYTHRVAISNHRLVALDDGNVTFRWRDSAHGNKERLNHLAGRRVPAPLPLAPAECRRTTLFGATRASFTAYPRVRCMNPQPQSRIILLLRHAQSLCVSAGPKCPANLPSNSGQPPENLRSCSATAAPSRQQQLCKSSGPAQPYTKPHRLPRGAASCKSLYLTRPS